MLSFFPRGVLDEILNLIESVSEDYPSYSFKRGWSGGAMVLGKLPVPGRPTIWITVGQGPIALAVGAGGGCLDIFTLIYPFFPLSPYLWETARYRLKYCLKGPLNPKQPTNNQLFQADKLAVEVNFTRKRHNFVLSRCERNLGPRQLCG